MKLTLTLHDMNIALVEDSRIGSLKGDELVTGDEVYKRKDVNDLATARSMLNDERDSTTRRQFSRQLGQKSAHDSAVHTYKHDLARLVGLDDPSKNTDQKAHNEH